MCNFLAPKSRLFWPKCKNLLCRKGLPGSQRGRCHRAATALSQCNGHPVATSGGPYGKTGAFPPYFQRLSGVLKRDFHLSPFFAQQCLQKRFVCRIPRSSGRQLHAVAGVAMRCCKSVTACYSVRMKSNQHTPYKAGEADNSPSNLIFLLPMLSLARRHAGEAGVTALHSLV